MQNWILPKQSNGGIEIQLTKHFIGEKPPQDRLDRIEELLEKQVELQVTDKKGTNGSTRMFTIGGICAFILLIISGFVWLEGRLDNMVEKASPYMRDKAAIMEKNAAQDAQIMELKGDIRELTARVDTNMSRLDTVIKNQETILSTLTGKRDK